MPADLEAEANRLLHWAHHDPCWEAKKGPMGTGTSGAMEFPVLGMSCWYLKDLHGFDDYNQLTPYKWPFFNG